MSPDADTADMLPDVAGIITVISTCFIAIAASKQLYC